MDDIINTKLTSVFRMSKAVLRGMMKAKTGRIINNFLRSLAVQECRTSQLRGQQKQVC